VIAPCFRHCESCRRAQKKLDITIATLDTPDSMHPAGHIWMEDAVGWDRPNDDLPQFKRCR
jgi:hypothetical protein